MASWTAFQSVIQLAIALNCAFATLAPFLGSAPERDRLLAADYAQQLDNYETALDAGLAGDDNASRLLGEIIAVQSCLDGIKQSSGTTDIRIASFLNGSIRLVCLASAAISLGCLFFSSYAASTDDLPVLGHVFMYLQYAPFVAGVTWIMWLSRAHLANRSRLSRLVVRIRAIENKIAHYKNFKRERLAVDGRSQHMPGMSGALQEAQASRPGQH
ncbi:hypothetical protein MKK84_00360 [Methylobacterium sp. E-065]|uniref:hypothetical protein n=1 Tax=Methylobacterium sp. E-065 TaxID=2836583 RepID=UPI001FBA9F38|nr:hypothetical protein [Methylobacterium sp. E-065]MCJ2015893.1 hypothetical protein [Methylobacterium sp. E-065]